MSDQPSNGLSLFEKIVRDLIEAGEMVVPIFIHSPRGVAILNASEEGMSAIIGAHQIQQIQQQKK